MRYMIGVLLITAAILKAAQLLAEPQVALAIPLGPWLVPLQIGLEIAFGSLVLTGLYWKQVRWTTAGLFTAFALYSLYLALNGAASCGCFGIVKINPWWMFLVDIAIVVILLVAIRRNIGGDGQFHGCPPWSQRSAFAMLMGAVSVLAITLLTRHLGHRSASADSLLQTVGDLVILEPEQWVGKLLPIAEFIDIDLSRGNWTVLLHRHDCPDCQKAIPQYEYLASQRPVVLVAVPPYPPDHEPTSGVAHRARLSSDRDWFVQTPVELQLQDGLVVAVSHGHGG